MNTEEIIRNIEPRYTVVKNKDLGKDATVYYHEDDVKKAIAKALTLGNVVDSLPSDRPKLRPSYIGDKD
jgi:hypothetical protein